MGKALAERVVGETSPSVIGKLLKDVSGFDLLEREEEVGLAIEKSDAFCQFRKIAEKLTAEEQEFCLRTGGRDFLAEDVATKYLDQLGKLCDDSPTDRLKLIYRDAKQAHDRLWQCWEKMSLSSIRLVVYLAKKYHPDQATFPDLVSEGCIGLFCAAQRFDHGNGAKFSTFAEHYIRMRMRKVYSQQSLLVRIPPNVVTFMWRLHEVVLEECREADRLEFFESALVDRLAQDLDVAHETAIAATRFFTDSFSRLDNFLADDDSSSAREGDLISDRESVRADDALIAQERREIISRVLNSLSLQERRIIQLRYGLGEKNGEEREPLTLREIGERLGLSRERIRQIQVKAEERMRVRLSCELG